MIIDKYYCINLFERTDRYQNAKNLFNKYKLPVDFYQVHRHPKGGVFGCFESHISIINDAYKNGYDTIMIFEDDIVCDLDVKSFNDKLNTVIEFTQNNEYDIFFLGCVTNIFNEYVSKYSDEIYQVNALCTHAYILSKQGILRYKDLKFDGQPIDMIFKKSDKAYAIKPSIFYQDESDSDVTPQLKFFGMKKNLMKLHEWYVTNINIPLIIILVLSGIGLFFYTNRIIFLIIIILIIAYYI